MTVIVRDDGFHSDMWEKNGGLFIDLEKFGQDVTQQAVEKTAIDIPNNVAVQSLEGVLENAAMLRIPFPSFADGRGFSIAKQLRHAGYKGTLRAVGHVIADQYGFARSCGFDEVEIDDDLAARQPEEQWLARKPKDDLSYQKKLLKRRDMRNA